MTADHEKHQSHRMSFEFLQNVFTSFFMGEGQVQVHISPATLKEK